METTVWIIWVIIIMTLVLYIRRTTHLAHNTSERVIKTVRLSVEKQRKGHYFLLVGDDSDPSPFYIIEFESATVCRRVLDEAMTQLSVVTAEEDD